MGNSESSESNEFDTSYEKIGEATSDVADIQTAQDYIEGAKKQLSELQNKEEKDKTSEDKKKITELQKSIEEKNKIIKEKYKEFAVKMKFLDKDGLYDTKKRNDIFRQLFTMDGGLNDQVTEKLKKTYKIDDPTKATPEQYKVAVSELIDDKLGKFFSENFKSPTDPVAVKKFLKERGLIMSGILGSLVYGCVVYGLDNNCSNINIDDTSDYTANSGCVISSTETNYMIGACGFPSPSMYGAYCSRTCDTTGENPYASPCAENLTCNNNGCDAIPCTNNQCIYNYYGDNGYELQDLVDAGSISFCSSSDGSVESSYNTSTYECSTNSLLCQTKTSGGICDDTYIKSSIKKIDSSVDDKSAENIIKSLNDNDGNWTWSSACVNTDDLFMTAYILTYIDVYTYNTQISPVMLTVQIILLIIFLIIILKMFYDIYKKYK